MARGVTSLPGSLTSTATVVLRRLQRLEAALASATDDGNHGASIIGLADDAGGYASTTVEDAFAEIHASTGAAIIGIADSGNYYTTDTVEAALHQLAPYQQGISIGDPGNGGAILVINSGVCMLTSAGAETRTIAAPGWVGQQIGIISDVNGGTVTITASAAINQAGNTHMAFAQVSDFILLIGVKANGGVLKWRVAANDGVALS